MNRKSKAIIDAAVAMGYGAAEDYSGGSVGATLEEFAAIAQEQGGGGGGAGGGYDPYVVEIEGIGTEQGPSTTAVFADAKTAFLANKPVFFRFAFGTESVTIARVSTLVTRTDSEKLSANMGGNSVLSWNSDGTFGDD